MRKYSEVMESLTRKGFDDDVSEMLNVGNFGRLVGRCDFAWGVVRTTAIGSFLTVMVTAPDRERARSLLKDMLKLCLDTDDRICGAMSVAAGGSALEPAPPIDFTGFVSGMNEMGCGMTRLGVEVTKDMLLMLPWLWMNIHQLLALTAGVCHFLPAESSRALMLSLMEIHKGNVEELTEVLESKALTDGPSLDMAAKWAASVDEWLRSGGCMPFGAEEEAGVLKAVTERFGAPWLVPEGPAGIMPGAEGTCP